MITMVKKILQYIVKKYFPTREDTMNLKQEGRQINNDLHLPNNNLQFCFFFLVMVQSLISIMTI